MRIETMLSLSKTKTRSIARAIRGFLYYPHFKSRIGVNVPVIVYQMGKVGSLSIYRSLRKYYDGVVIHTHDFEHDHDDVRIRKLYKWFQEGRELKIISLTREPVSRNVSAFFQNFRRDVGVSYSRSEYTIDELREIFLANYPHEIPLEWFDKNIKKNFGIDVFEHPFPENGYALYTRRNVKVLVMRVELSDKEKVKAIKDFIGIEEFDLVNTNIGSEKKYAEETSSAVRRKWL